jgi:Spy/CpxP family protein refolding chaperone
MIGISAARHLIITLTHEIEGIMKRIRIFALLAALVAFAAPAAHAQGGGGQGRGRQMEALMKDITLTDAQKAQVDSIGQAFRAQMPPMTQGTPPDSATRAKMGEVRQKQYAAIRTVLTPDQQKVFDKNLAELPPMGGRPRP